MHMGYVMQCEECCQAVGLGLPVGGGGEGSGQGRVRLHVGLELVHEVVQLRQGERGRGDARLHCSFF